MPILAILAVIFTLSVAPLFGGCASSVSRVDQPTEEILVTLRLGETGLADTAGELGADHGLHLRTDWPLESLGVHCFVYRPASGLARELPIEELIARLAGDARVESAQRMNLFEVLSSLYDDPQFPHQIGMHALNVAPVHRWATGKGVRVGVVDTGIDALHSELRGGVAFTKNFVVDEKGDAGIPERHGTAIAGVVAAQGNNATGIVGVAPDAELVGLRACWQEKTDRRGKCSSFTLARAINFAIIKDLDILNLSLQGHPDPLLERLIERARGQGIVVVAAYDPTRKKHFPAEHPGVLAVADSSRQVAIAQKSIAFFAAPGTDILTTTPNESYDFLSGSSLSAAHATGVVALLLQVAPNLSLEQLGDLLDQSARDPQSAPGQSLRREINACDSVVTLLKSRGTVDESEFFGIDCRHHS